MNSGGGDDGGGDYPGDDGGDDRGDDGGAYRDDPPSHYGYYYGGYYYPPGGRSRERRHLLSTGGGSHLPTYEPTSLPGSYYPPCKLSQPPPNEITFSSRHLFSFAHTANGGDVRDDCSSFAFKRPSFFEGVGDWDMSSVTTIEGMFYGAQNFNEDLSNWDVSRVTNMRYTFSSTNFNQPIGEWDGKFIITVLARVCNGIRCSHVRVEFAAVPVRLTREI